MRHRDFGLLWLGETVSRLGTSVTSVAMPLLAVAAFGASSLYVGVLNAAEFLPWLLVALPVGAWLDRVRRRPVMLACDAALFLLLGSVPVAAWLGVLTLGQLPVVMFLGGICTAVFALAYRVYVPSVVARQDLIRANSALQGSEQAAQIGGRGLGGLLAQVLGPASALLADTASFAVSAACLLGIRAREQHPVAAAGRPAVRHQIATGLRFTAADPYLRSLSAFSAVGNLGYTGYQTLQVVFLVRDIGVRPGLVGLLVTASSVGGIAGALAAPRTARRYGTARAIMGWAMGTAPFGCLIPLATAGPGLLLIVVGGAALGAGLVAAGVIMVSFRQSYCPAELLGRVSASMQFLNNTAIPLGTLGAGALGTLLGNRTALWAVAAVFLAYGVVLLAGPLRGRRDLPATSRSNWSAR